MRVKTVICGGNRGQDTEGRNREESQSKRNNVRETEEIDRGEEMMESPAQQAQIHRIWQPICWGPEFRHVFCQEVLGDPAAWAGVESCRKT
jgi:hypothetical protein